MKPFKPAFLAILLGLASVMSSVSSMALTSDRDQPIYIESDRAERDDKKGITIYQGRVKMEQGSMQIHADKVTIHSTDNKINRIIATGNPARYQQQPSPNKKPVVAEGGTIRYEIDAEHLLLLSNAFIAQEGTTMSGERIDYDIAQSLMRAAGSDQRIQMVITPESETDESSKPGKPNTLRVKPH